MALDLNLDGLEQLSSEGVGADIAAAAGRNGKVGGPHRSRNRIDTPIGPYLPRMIAGKLDVDFVAAELAAGRNVQLIGEPGSGKTALAEAVAVTLGRTCHTAVCGAGADASTCLGRYAARPGGEFVWLDGPVTRAVKGGGIAVVDEIGQMEHGEQMRLVELLDSRRRITLDEHEGEVLLAVTGERPTPAQAAHAEAMRAAGVDAQVGEGGFGFLISYNPDLVDIPGLAEPIMDRCATVIEVETSYETALALGVNPNLVSAAKALSERRKGGQTDWAPSMRTMLQHRDMEADHGTGIANQNLITRCAADRAGGLDSLDTVIEVLRAEMEADLIEPLVLRD